MTFRGLLSNIQDLSARSACMTLSFCLYQKFMKRRKKEMREGVLVVIKRQKEQRNQQQRK